MAERKKKCEDCGGGEWALSYGDMMTLLCTFFILIVSFSSTELIKFRQAMGSMRGSMGVLLEQDGASIIAKSNNSLVKSQDNSQPSFQILQNFEEKIFKLDIENGVEIEIKNDGYNIRLSDDLIFAPGTAKLNPSMYDILDDLGIIIHFYAHNVKVEGHTDNVPIFSDKFGSNWELSAARAISVVKYFVNNLGIDPTRFTVAGCGGNKPLLPNTTPENRRRNRRVEIYIVIRDKNNTTG
ncbi:flagellar motor protein MotB [bacterium]|nr:flagellar motor protein MotB [bacterium]